MIPDSGKIDVLITVKTSPQPSTKYKDTVCVAGLYLAPDGPPEHIRLYPIPFRHLDDKQQFHKYDIRTFEITANPQDNRPESRKVILNGPVPLVNHLPPWKKRAELVEQVERVTMCEINRVAKAGATGPSLGLVKPAAVLGIDIEESPPLTEEQVRERQQLLAQQELDLFQDSKADAIKALEQPPLRAWIRYRCAEATCAGRHRQGILDWELTALQLRGRREGRPLDQLREDIRRNFLERPTRTGRELSLFVGNQANPQKRGTFSVLGLYYPEQRELPLAIQPLF